VLGVETTILITIKSAQTDPEVWFGIAAEGRTFLPFVKP